MQVNGGTLVEKFEKQCRRCKFQFDQWRISLGFLVPGMEVTE
jgi:hypothetical protein